MSPHNRGYSQQGQRGQQQGQQGVNFRRDPNTGQFLDEQESRQLQQYAQQHPQEVRRAYQQNAPIPGISYSEETGQRPQGQQSRGQQQGGQRGGTHQQSQGGQWGGQQRGQQTQQGGQWGGQQQTQQRSQQQMQPQQQSGYVPAQQEPASNQPGWPGKQGRGADQGAADRRHSQQFRQRMHEIAEQRPRDPQTGQFLPTGQGGQQGQQRGGQRGQGGGQMYAQQGQQRNQQQQYR